MAKVTDSGFSITGKTTIICDYSPPRGGTFSSAPAPPNHVDFLSVNSNPGRSVRTDSAMLAASLKQQSGKEVIFSLLTRDMNRLAVQSHLLGAHMLGLENVIVAQGDSFTEADKGNVKSVRDYRPTELLSDISNMNKGRDFRGRALVSPTDFCAGATLDLGGDMGLEAALAERKISAGAEFLITQPVYKFEEVARFHEAYARLIRKECPVPVFFGLQILERGGVSFGTVPGEILADLEAGRSGVDIALEVFERLSENSVRDIYLLPPIRRGSERDYGAAQEFLEAVRSMEKP